VRADNVKNQSASEPNQWWDGDASLSRRQLLGAAAATVVGVVAGGRASGAQSTSRPAERGERPDPPAAAGQTSTLPSRPWWMRRGDRSRVVDVGAPRAVHGWVVDEDMAAGALDLTFRTQTGARDGKEAWREVLGSARRIALKFNAVGADVLRTSLVMARLLVTQIRAAGYGKEPLMLVEMPDHVVEDLECARASRGWGAAVRVGDHDEPLARYLWDADAIVNVAFLKTHRIAGMSGCMKNISHAVIRHPARYHANGCSPFVGRIIGSAPVSSRLRLNLVNAFRIVIRNGPEASEQDVVTYGGIVAGFDPVAVDRVGLSILERARRDHELPVGLNVRYLAAAAHEGLGRGHPAEIERIALETRA
jgi:hypothetical protein